MKCIREGCTNDARTKPPGAKGRPFKTCKAHAKEAKRPPAVTEGDKQKASMRARRLKDASKGFAKCNAAVHSYAARQSLNILNGNFEEAFRLGILVVQHQREADRYARLMDQAKHVD